MSATLTSPPLQNLLPDVRTMLRPLNPSNSTWLDDELTSYINEAINIYFLECTTVNEGYFTTQTGTDDNPDLNIVNAVETIALPVDCFQVKNVWKAVDNGWVSLNYRNNTNESYFTTTGTTLDSYFPSYYFQGNSIVLRPTPNDSQVGGIRLEYLQFPDTLIYGGDTLTNQIAPVFKQLVVMYAVYKAKLSESMTNGVNMSALPKSNLDQLVQLFKDTIAKRSKNQTYVQPFNPENGY